MSLEQQSNTMSVGELDKAVEFVFAQKEKLKGMEEIVKKQKALISKAEYKILDCLEDNGLEKFAGSKGTVSRRRITSVRVPKGEDRVLFFNYLKKKGVFDDLITVNSATLNSWYKAELETAIEEGNDDFKIDGIGEPTVTVKLQARKA